MVVTAEWDMKHNLIWCEAMQIYTHWGDLSPRVGILEVHSPVPLLAQMIQYHDSVGGGTDDKRA